jgi:hypothetical protein
MGIETDSVRRLVRERGLEHEFEAGRERFRQSPRKRRQR